jgi:hypothetical protein
MTRCRRPVRRESLQVPLPDKHEQVRSGATKLVCGNYEPHRRYSHQEPEADYARCYHVIRVVHVDVQSEVLERPKPDHQSKHHEHCYTNEMFHQRPIPHRGMR